MDQHLSAALWVGAMLIGFMIGWPVGAAILAAITVTAISQQITGYRLPPPQQPRRSVGEQYVYELKLERQLEEAQRQIAQTKVLQITDQSKRR